MTKAELIYAITGDVERYLQAIKDDKPNHFADAGKMAEPTECNHIWDNRLISAFSKEKGEIVKMKECRKCGKWEETTDNTKIEELEYDVGCEEVRKIMDKLNEVINKVNAQTTVVLAHQKDIEEIKNDLDY